MRMDQRQGLCKKAIAFLQKYEVPEEVCEHCERPFPRTFKYVGSYFGMHNVRYPLFRHTLKDGSWADEFVQDAPWFSGPMFFLGLRYGNKEFLWSSETIDKLSGEG